MLVEDLGLVPGQPRDAALAQQPVDRRGLARRAQGRRRRGHHHAGAARQRDPDPDRELTRPAVALSTTGSSTTWPRPPEATCRSLAYGGSTGTTTSPRAAPPRAASSPTSTTAADDVALLGPDVGHHRRPEDHHALPPRHPGRSPTPSAGTSCGRRRTTSSRAPPPLAFTFGLGVLVVFPLRSGASALLTERATPVRAGAELVRAARGHRPVHRADGVQGRSSRTAPRRAARRPADRGLGRRAPARGDLASRPRDAPG